METNSYSYDWFMERSKKLDREKNKLPYDSYNMIKEIKKKLNIRDFNDLKNEIRYNKNKFKSNNETLNSIYKNLNKITEKTYEKLSSEIINTIENMIENECEEKVQEDICRKIFDIIRNNSICCQLYAKLYNDLIEKHKIFKTIFQNQLDVYLKKFKEFNYVSPEEDYDKYCLYVKHIEESKNYTLFLLQCLTYSICNLDEMVELLLYFQNQLKVTLYIEDNMYEKEQMIETIYIIIKEISDLLMFNEQWSIILSNHKEIKEIKSKGKTKKMEFKLMDIDDIIKMNNNSI